ncbi:hypothetical protein [Rhodoferax sp. BAB1]|uniref:hypothetical protein n=1 Tax=Rhodoferax sp. BAB1 TaxID=2741720 RepID=UPI001576D164|nr:hypothetical protein [Rhodoferax sp. BAB1]QKO21809.1 hypothetical protein HTY51_07845 [Rhodoferax sp. BAB1]
MSEAPKFKEINAYPSLPSLQDVQVRISELEGLDLAKADFEFIKDRLRLLVHGFSVQAFIFEKGRIFYRGRLLESPPKSIAEVGMRSAELNEGYGRLHRPKTTVLYTNLAVGSVSREIKAEPGKTIALSCFRAKRPFHAIGAGLDDEAIRGKGWSRNGMDWSRLKQGELARTLNIEVNRFLAKQFVKDVPGDQDFQYMISAAWAESILGANAVDAVVYPSVANSAISDNVGFKASSVDDLLELVRVDFIRLDDLPQGANTITFLNKSTSIVADGTLLFSSPTPFDVIKPWSGTVDLLSFQLEGTRWTMTTRAGELLAIERES